LDDAQTNARFPLMPKSMICSLAFLNIFPGAQARLWVQVRCLLPPNPVLR